MLFCVESLENCYVVLRGFDIFPTFSRFVFFAFFCAFPGWFFRSILKPIQVRLWLSRSLFPGHYISLFPEGWQGHNYVACCGTSSIPVLEMLRQLPQLRRVYLCLDNDAAGHAASERMAVLLKEHGLNAVRLVPQQKDWNDDLKTEQENKMERSELCQTFC